MNMSRRNFMHGAAAAGTALAFPAIVPARVLGVNAPSNMIHVAQIGCGRIGLTMDVPGFLRAKGAKITSSVTKNTTALILGENPGKSKLDKATKLGIPTLDEAALLELIK
jgi:hypothetical protein